LKNSICSSIPNDFAVLRFILKAMVTIKIDSETAGMRLDRLLRKRLALMTLSDIYSLIRKGGVRIDGKKVKQDYRLKESETLELTVDASELQSPKKQGPEPARLANTEFFKRHWNVIFEDADLLACDKPAGLVVHPGTGHLAHDTLIDLATAYMAQKPDSAVTEPVLVHRLDRDTSGVILIAKSKRVVRQLNELFRTREVVKEYQAVCHHRPPEYEGTIRLGLVRDDRATTGMKMRVDDEGSVSQSRYRLLTYQHERSRIEVFLDTGKTHQIRVHLSHAGAPIIGDSRYGNSQLDDQLFKELPELPRRLYLHAFRLSLPHPVTGKKLVIRTNIPSEFTTIMEQHGSR
jgi:23S rRNA pseudouridine955/2504/2580 synthase